MTWVLVKWLKEDRDNPKCLGISPQPTSKQAEIAHGREVYLEEETKQF
jgi:hypothetical protein